MSDLDDLRAKAEAATSGPWVVGTVRTYTDDPVNHPAHYSSDPSGVECIQITRHRDFLIGSAIKYLWRAGLKRDADKTAAEKEVEDLRKAIWYINERINLITQKGEGATP